MPLASISQACTHNVYIKGLCGNCGIRLDPPQSTSVSMIHSVPELKVSQEYAKEIGKDDQERLINERKLVLLVDLDQTILHTTHEEVKNDPNVHSFSLWPGHPVYYTKLRPFLEEFLEAMSKIYELHIFTFGCRKYAHKIASIIDPDQKYFGNRILSRDESVDQYSKRGNLNNLFPCGDAMVCIIDDRSDVWRDAGNLIQVKPYSYFQTSISDGAQRGAIVDDEALTRDVDKLEALLGLDDELDTNEAESKPQVANEEESKAQEKIEDESGAQDAAEGCNEPQDTTTNESESIDKAENDCGDDEQDNDSESEENLRKKKKLSDNESEEKSKANDKIEDSCPPSPFDDPDDHLLHLPNILERIHDKWYMELDEQKRFLGEDEKYNLPDIKDIIKRYLRKRF